MNIADTIDGALSKVPGAAASSVSEKMSRATRACLNSRPASTYLISFRLGAASLVQAHIQKPSSGMIPSLRHPCPGCEKYE